MLHERLKLILQTLKISQRQFAMKIDLDPGYFSRIVQGKSEPPDRILLLIESMFNVNKNWLVTGQGTMFKNEGISTFKKQLLDMIETLNEHQVHATTSFLKFLTESEIPTQQKKDE